MDIDKLKRLSNAVRTGGKGTVRRKKKAPHRTATTDDKRLQNTLKRLGVNTIPGIEEVNLFLDNNNVLHFTNPKGTAHDATDPSITVLYGSASSDYSEYARVESSVAVELSDLLPGIITQMGPDSLASLKRMAEQMQQMQHEPHMPQIAEDEDDVEVPELVENFEEASAEV